MISLFARHRATALNLVTLPTYAVSQEEPNELAAKRDAQLQWMRERGMAYLGDPLKQAELHARRRPGAQKMRLVSVRNDLAASDSNAGPEAALGR